MFRLINSWISYKPTYTVVFNVDPIDCTVVLDGVEGTNISGVVTFIKLAGTYYYEVSKDGYTTQSGNVEVSDNVELNITLEQAITQVKYGYLYNWFTLVDSRNITNTGFHVPTIAELNTLRDYLGGDTVAGGKLKETGLTYWNSGNTGATNEAKFNMRGSGWRNQIGQYTQLKLQGVINSTSSTSTESAAKYIQYNSASLSQLLYLKNYGFGVRLLKDSTTLTDGQEGTYTGNDGKIYRTICVGTQEWVADNLAETKYRNGDAIPTVTDDTAWTNLSTGAKCAYNNDESNVLI